MAGFTQDLLYELRQFRNHPGFAVIAVLTLALGIGATTAMFSLVDRALFRSLPYRQPDQLVSLGVIAPIVDGEFLFAANYLSWRHEPLPFSAFTSSVGVNDCDLTDDRPLRVSCASVASTFLPTFGIRPTLGRNFTEDEDRSNAPPVALISYGVWQTKYGSDSGLIDRTISINGKQVRIIGVLPPDFEFPTLAHVSIVVPQQLDDSLLQRNLMGPVVRVYGTLKPGVSMATASAQLQPLFQKFVDSAPPPFRKELRLQVRSIRDLQIHDSRRAAWLLLISAGALLLIACANVANLMLAQSVTRRHELAVRAALGAARVRLFQQRLTESILVGLAGAVAGCGLAALMVRIFAALAPVGIPHTADATLDGRVLLFAVIVSTAAAMIFGALPALEKPSMEILVATTTGGVRRGRLRQIFLVTQVSITVILLAGALLLLRSLRNLQEQPLGMNAQNVVTAEITLGKQKYGNAAAELAFFEQLEQRLKTLPGLNGVALADSLPPTTPAHSMPFIALRPEGQAPGAGEGVGGMVGHRSVTPDYFSVLGIPFLRGSAFQEQDRQPGVFSMIVNQDLAQRLYSGENPLGKIVQIQTSDEPRKRFDNFMIVGVTANTQNRGLGARPGPEFYLVRRHTPTDITFRFPDSRHLSIVARTVVDAQAAANELKTAIATVDPTIPVEPGTLDRKIYQLAERPRFNAALLLAFAVIALVVAAVGIYGLVSLLVSQRTQEIAIHIALGAAPGSVTRRVISQACIWVSLGAAAGIIGSLFLARWIGSLLVGIRPDDPATLVEAAIALIVLGIFAAYIPARRASKVDPIVALRYE